MNKDRISQRKENILQAASKLIVHFGFEKTTVEDIAHEAGVSKGAIYLVWPSKDALLDELIVFEMRRLVLDFQRRLEQDPRGGTIASLYTHSLLALNDNPLVRALYTRDGRVLGDYVRRQDVRRYTRRIQLAEDSIRQMQAANLLRQDAHPEVIAHMLSIISVGFIYISTIVPPAEQPPLEEVIRLLGSVIQLGLASPSGEAAAGKEAIGRLSEFLLQQYNEAEAKHED